MLAALSSCSPEPTKKAPDLPRSQAEKGEPVWKTVTKSDIEVANKLTGRRYLASILMFPGAKPCPFSLEATAPFCAEVTSSGQFDPYIKSVTVTKAKRSEWGHWVSGCMNESCFYQGDKGDVLDTAGEVQSYIKSGSWLVDVFTYRHEIAGYRFFDFKPSSRIIRIHCFIVRQDAPGIARACRTGPHRDLP